MITKRSFFFFFIITLTQHYMFHSAVMLKLHYHFKLSILDQGGLNTENNGSQSQEHCDAINA